MKTIGYTCPFVPPGWIVAHGLTPIRLVPDGGWTLAGEALDDAALGARMEALMETVRHRRRT